MRVLSDYIPQTIDGETTFLPRVVADLGSPDFTSHEYCCEREGEWRVIVLDDSYAEQVAVLGYEVLP